MSHTLNADKNRTALSWLLAVFILMTYSCTGSATVNPRLDSSAAGKIINIAGEVEVLAAGKVRWREAGDGQLLYPGDSVRTGRTGKASLIMSDETMMQLNRNTRFQLKEVERSAGWFGLGRLVSKVSAATGSLYEVLRGKVWARNKSRRVPATFRMPSMTAGIRGTELTIEVDDDGNTTTVVLEGRVEHANDFGSVVAGAGETVSATPGSAPVKQVLLQPEDAVQWTLVIPPVFDESAFAAGALPPADSNAISSAIAEGRYLDARDLVSGQDGSSADTRLLLSVIELYLGEPVVSNRQLRAIDPALLRNDGRRAVYWRTLAIAALMTNDAEQALAAADSAMRIAGDDAATVLVKAYVLQSRFELEKARGLLERLLDREPANLQALLMLAQLQFGSGENDAAWRTMMRAQRIEPENAMVNNLAGYILLSLRRHGEAVNAFDEALEADAGSAEAHMGLGLLAMRAGDAALALEEITLAVALEPQRSLLVSYWGKMLYQVGRYDKALDMFERAERLDANDPTPTFYRAIILRDLNRHGEAIGALNAAVAKNDNRAVYRSRFLLDKDLAVRNVDLSILYDQLGLERWAERKAVSAIKQDFGNYSAHLFYAGVLSEDEDRSYPQGSEALLARLLQPANVNTFNTFNDYTAFFEQPDIGGELTLAAGNLGASQAQAVVYGAAPDADFAWSALASTDKTDGWRDTNFEETSAAAVLAKWAPGEGGGLLITALVSEIEQGDKASPRYEFDDPASPTDRQELELAAAELGYHHKPSPDSDVLAYLTWQGFEGDSYSFEDNLAVAPALYTETATTEWFKRPYTQLQLQYMNKSESHQFIAGLLGFSGRSRLDSVEQIDAVDRGPVPPVVAPLFTNTINSHVDIEFISAYVQDSWQAGDGLLVEAALYADSMDNANVRSGETWTVDGVYPRLGLAWDTGARSTLRLAAFKYLLPFVASRADPTEVAGVSIYRNAREGTETTEFDLVWEHETGSGLFALSAFVLESDSQAGAATVFESEQSGAEISYDMLASHSVGVSMSYRFEQTEDRAQPSLDRDDQYATIGARYQSPSGLYAGIEQGWRKTVFESARADESIPITDFDIGYEFADKAGELKLEVRNAFDEQFNWVVDAFTVTGRNPAREVLLTGTINF